MSSPPGVVARGPVGVGGLGRDGDHDGRRWIGPGGRRLPEASGDGAGHGVAPLHSMNTYGLFAVMTTDRPEIIVEGSADGVTWRPYSFRWKPGDVDLRPRFTTPHMPRLDWQMWFAALARDCRSQGWFLAFEQRLLEGSPRCWASSGQPVPRQAAAVFAGQAVPLSVFTGRGASAWWRREEVGSYCPPAGL